MVKNKAFFFGGFDQEILTASTQYSTGLLTSDPGRSGNAGWLLSNRSCSCCGIGGIVVNSGPYGVSAGNPTPGHITTQTVDNCVSPIEVGTVSRVLATPFHGFNFVTKEDITLGSNDNLSMRYIFNRGNNFNTNDNGAAGLRN